MLEYELNTSESMLNFCVIVEIIRGRSNIIWVVTRIEVLMPSVNRWDRSNMIMIGNFNDCKALGSLV